jgi:hypothetical protein
MDITQRKRRLFHKNPPYSASRTVIPKTAVFETLTVYRYGRKVDWAAVRRHLKSFSKAVILAQNCEPDAGSGIFEFRSDRLLALMLINTAGKILSLSQTQARHISLVIADRTGEYSAFVSGLVGYAGRITVFTENTQRYSYFASEMLDTFGAVITVTCQPPDLARSDIFINLSQSGEKPLSVTLCGGTKQLRQGRITCPENLALYKPKNAETYSYLSALYSLCSVSEPAKLCFDSMIIGSREISLQSAAKMLDTERFF